MMPGWEGQLATITLTGPGGSFTLDADSDLPTAILRDPRNGQVRGILRDPPPATRAAANAAAGRAASLEVLFSRASRTRRLGDDDGSAAAICADVGGLPLFGTGFRLCHTTQSDAR